MLKRIENRTKFLGKTESVFVILLVLFFISELATTVSYYLRFPFYNYSQVIKAGFIGFIGFLLLKNRFKPYFLSVFIGGMALIFLVGQWAFNDFEFGSHLFENSLHFGRFVFVFFIVLLFHTFPKGLSPMLFTVFEKLMIFNAVLMLLTIVFDITMFKTYYFRFGASGIFMTPSMITYFNALGLTYFLNCFLKDKKKLPELLLLFVVCFLSGTKALLFFVFLTGIHLFILKRIYLKRLFYLSVLFVLGMGFFLKEAVAKFFASNFEPLIQAYNEFGWWAALTSLRSQNLKENFLPVIREKWGLLNYLFGGTDFESYRVEFEPFDIFLFFGIVGVCWYFYRYFCDVMNFKSLSSFGKIQMIILLMTVAVSGNFFNNAPMSLYLVIVIYALSANSKKINEEI